MSTETLDPMFSQAAQQCLADLYASANAKSTLEKIAAIEKELGPSQFYGFGGEVTDDVRLGCLECEYLIAKNLLEDSLF